MTPLPQVAVRQLRRQVLSGIGAGAAEAEELLAYNENVFRTAGEPLEFPLADEPFVAVWQEYADRGFVHLQSVIPQLSFPVRAGISESAEYRAATRKGAPVRGSGLALRAPHELRIVIHPAPAGRIPLLIAHVREDFVSLVQALTMRNEPGHVPDSMGAAMVAGFNNWDRVARYRASWEREHPGQSWDAGFQQLIPRKHLYQDRFILLSDGPYSGVPASDLGLDDESWRGLSLTIRREHECAHYFTRRVFQSMRNNILDELIADYCGIVAAASEFRADWFLRFVGLESYPGYREGGRLQNYRGGLSDSSFVFLQRLVVDAARNVESFGRQRRERRRQPPYLPAMIATLSRLTLEELAAPESPAMLESAVAGNSVLYESESSR
ncbi:MAG: hypothetical protein R2729_26265 [Bryobacteraceae bacterium]